MNLNMGAGAGRGKRDCHGPAKRPLGSGAKPRYNACMNTTLKITKIGNSAGIILPKDVLARLRVEVGDDIYISETADGMRITASDPEFASLMDIAEGIMRKDRDILKVLAK